MTRICYYRNEYRLRAEGHAGAAACGQDVVCAAVSTAMEMLETNLLAFGCRCGGRRGAALHEVDGKGYQAYKLMDATASFLRALAYQYPEYVSFTEKILENKNAWGENGI